MSFFSKLRERLTKSSSKISGGLDDLVAEGATPQRDRPQPDHKPRPARPAAPDPTLRRSRHRPLPRRDPAPAARLQTRARPNLTLAPA